MTDNPYAGAARLRKAEALIETARDEGVTAFEVATDSGVRDELVAAAGVREPSLETWGMVVVSLAEPAPERDVAEMTADEVLALFGHRVYEEA